MTDFTRAEWGAEPPKYARKLWDPGQPTSYTLHYEGSDVDVTHDSAYWASVVRAIQHYHLWFAADNYADIAYNFVVAPNGDRFEGVGWGYRSQAQLCGNPVAVAVCYIGGANTPLTDAAKASILRTIAEGGIKPVNGHRDWACVSTSCPGDTIEAWIAAGLPAPAPPPPVPPREGTMIESCVGTDGTVYIFAVGTDDHVYVNHLPPGATAWAGWGDLAGIVRK